MTNFLVRPNNRTQDVELGQGRYKQRNLSYRGVNEIIKGISAMVETGGGILAMEETEGGT
jgi:hypothetical protein